MYILPSMGNIYHLCIGGEPACGIKLELPPRVITATKYLVIADECRQCYEIEQRQKLLKELGE